MQIRGSFFFFNLRNLCNLWIPLLLSSILLSIGCARQVVVTPQLALDYGQLALRQMPPEIDISALKGKRIVIDPGHGGSFGGAVGPNNLREADVNLGVGLYLWGMLQQAGAEAYLTRTDDSNVYQGTDFDLKKDLQARAEFARVLKPDLFVSLHHNADVLPGAKRNSLETYFKMSDPGPSLDVAQHVHKQLALSLKQPENSVLPGNYHVLREYPGPAVLGEPSYISHADNSFKLGLAPIQRLEAQAYFLGIAEYFAKGVPRIEEMGPTGPVSTTASPLLSARVKPDRGAPIDPASIEMRLDGKPVNSAFDQAASRISYLPERRLDNGKHIIEISARNINGNAAQPARAEFSVAMAPAFILVDANFRAVRPYERQAVRLTAKVFDADAMPVADGTPVQFSATEGLITPAVAYTSGGEAAAYLAAAGAGTERTITATVRVGWLSHDLNVFAGFDADDISTVTVLDARDEKPIAGALVALDGRPTGRTDRGGYFAAAAREFSGSCATVTALGYIPETVKIDDLENSRTLRIRPIAEGVLFDKLIALDPQFGGEEKGMIGPTGVRASDVNLRVARFLAGFLSASGADIMLTRDSDITATPLSRVETAERFGSQLFVSIGHSGSTNPPAPAETAAGAEIQPARAEVMHYPNSKDGARLGGSIAAALQAAALAENIPVKPATDFVLTHTSSPAVLVSLPGPATPEIEQQLREPEAARREAYAIYCGILEHLGLVREQTGRLLVRVPQLESGDVLLTLDGALTFRCSSGGEFMFRWLTPGLHRIEAFSAETMLWIDEVSVIPGETASLDIPPSAEPPSTSEPVPSS